MNTRELLAAPRGETLAACANSWETQGKKGQKKRESFFLKMKSSHANSYILVIRTWKKLTLRATWSSPALTACSHCLIHQMVVYVWRSDVGKDKRK